MRPFHDMLSSRLRNTIFVASLALITSSAAAQESVNYGSVSGRVADGTGAVLPGASVTARQTETNVTSATTTDSSGRFRFPFLRIGAYEITCHISGFVTTTQKLTVAAGGAFEVPVTLSIAGMASEVQVTAEAPAVETARSQIAGTVSIGEINTLPLNGRNFLDIALLVPGVAPTNVGGGTQQFAETSAVSGTGISVGSQRNMSNNFIVDGLSANDDAAALSGMTYGVDAVDQFQVVTSGGQAELGRALGGYINVVTKSGTNTLKGNAYSYTRDDLFNAKNSLIGRTLPMHQNQYGASLGGPVVRNRAFYFANVERKALKQTGLVTVGDSSVATINARLAAIGYKGPSITTGVYDNPAYTTNAVVKVDHQIVPSNHLSVRYSAYDLSATNARGAGALNTPSASAGIDNLDQTIAVSNIAVLSTRVVNEARGQVAWSDLKALPSDPIGPAVSISGVASFGTSSGSPTGRVNTMYQLVDSLSLQAGAHAVRAGVDFIYNDLSITYPRSVRGAYTFASLATFLTGTYNNAGFTQTFGESVVDQTNPNLGLYVQDEWKIGSRLTLNAGIRYDLQYLETIRTDRNNVSPRVGFAWVPTSARRTVVRGSGGIFYDRVPLRALANALLSAGNTTDLANLRQIGVSLSPTQSGAPVFPNILSAIVPTVTLVNLSTMNPNMQNASSIQGSLEIEQQLGATGSVSIGYEHLRGRDLIMSINQNVPTCVAAGTNNGCRPVSTYANNSQYSPAGKSDYNAVHVTLVQRPSQWGNYRISYAYSKSMNNVGEAFFSGPIDPFDINKDWARSDDDQRHRLVLNGTITTPMSPATTTLDRLTHGFELSAMVQAYSALPYNITSGVTTVQGTAGRPIVDGNFISRNAGVGTAFATFSLRMSRSLPLAQRASVQLLAEVFNVTNRVNVLNRNGNFGAGAYPTSPSSTFGQVLAVGDPRSMQLGARIRF
ncbi:MAG: TonB-dependent receptor [Acidobacteriota bacterium]